MKSQPQISIIVPVYKAEQLIGRCIKSILAQTFTNFELILINDGSPDKSGIICDEYASMDDRIKVIHKKNGGASSARNVGVEAARGKYIGWVDADDYIKEDMFKYLYDLAIMHDADIVESKYYTIIDDAISEGGCDEPLVFGNGDFAFYEFFNGRMKPNLFTKLYKRKIWEGVRFPIARNHQDCYVNILFSLRKINYVRTSEAFYYYIPKENSITTTISEKAIREAIYLFDFEKKLAKRNSISKTVKNYLNYDAINRLLLRYYYLSSSTSFKSHYIYNKIILRRIFPGFLLYFFNSRVIWKTRINYILMLFNLLAFKMKVKDLLNN